MVLKRYDAEDDFEYLDRLLAKRKMENGEGKDIPTIGYLALDGEECIAACFMRLIEGESRIAMVDGLISDPEKSSEKRNQAIELVVNKIISMAKEIGLNHLLAMTKDESVLIRGKSLGFNIVPHTVMQLDLRG